MKAFPNSPIVTSISKENSITLLAIEFFTVFNREALNTFLSVCAEQAVEIFHFVNNCYLVVVERDENLRLVCEFDKQLSEMYAIAGEFLKDPELIVDSLIQKMLALGFQMSPSPTDEILNEMKNAAISFLTRRATIANQEEKTVLLSPNEYRLFYWSNPSERYTAFIDISTISSVERKKSKIYIEKFDGDRLIVENTSNQALYFALQILVNEVRAFKELPAPILFKIALRLRVMATLEPFNLHFQGPDDK